MPFSYSPRRVLLHWLSAVILLWTLVSGFYVAYGPVSGSVQHSIGSFNVSLTTVFIPLFVWRACLFVRELRALESMLAWTQGLVLFVHAMIYLTIGVVLFTGVLMMQTAISVFGLIQIPQPLGDPSLIEWANRVHTLSCVMLSILVAMHIGAVIWHEVSGRRILRRMAFSKASGADSP